MASPAMAQSTASAMKNLSLATRVRWSVQRPFSSATPSSMNRATALRLLGLGGPSRRSRRRQHDDGGDGPVLLQISTPSPAKPTPPSATPGAFSARDLRDAYFSAAKRCHPDSRGAGEGGDGGGGSAHLFIRVTEAYEYLRSYIGSAYETDAAFVSKREEEEFRDACQEWLGVDADIVEESKRCPLFREWLQGNTDAAAHWNSFFCQHGGLAPKLRPPSALIEGGGKKKGPSRRRRR